MVVSFTVLGFRGMLGSVVTRRWQELGGVLDAHGEYVVNCARPDDVPLAWVLGERGKTVWPSTDAINEDTDYARDKRLIEAVPGLVVIRSGIVDVTHQPWPAAYSNWWCNPLTPLEWADLAWQKRDDPGVHVAGREPVSRYEVAVTVARIFGGPPPQRSRSDDRVRVQPVDRPRPLLIEALAAYRDWLG